MSLINALKQMESDVDPVLPMVVMNEAEVDSYVHAVSILQLVDTAASCDQETHEHMRRVGDISMEMAAAIGMHDDFLDEIRIAAMLHDIGKIGVPQHLLRKDGLFTLEERQEMKRHTSIGGDILAAARRHIPSGDDADCLVMAEKIARYHHEYYNGAADHGIAGRAIPLVARIVSIIDVYDALTSMRRYKRPWTHREAVGFIKSRSGDQFDPGLVEIFLDLIEKKHHNDDTI